MKLNSIIYTVIIMAFAQFANAQIGLRAGYNFNKYDNWNKMRDFSSENRFTQSSYEIGLNYWYRLPKIRVEFLPEVVLGASSTSKIDYNAVNYSFKYSYLDFRVNTQFYILNFKEECDCPTFKKNNRSVSKGLFLFATPGLRYSIKKESELNSKNNNLTFNMTVGVGYDIDINPNISITPLLGYKSHFSDMWEESNVIRKENIVRENYWSDINMSLRIGYKFEENKFKRR